MDDGRILSLLWSRAEDALAALADTYGKRLQHMAQNILHSAWDAQECVNDTYLALWNAIPPNRPDPLSAYVFRVCRNTALNMLRRGGAEKRGGSAMELSLDELASCIPGADMDERLDARLLGRLIDDFLTTQSPENRRLFLRRYWFGDSVKGIAREEGLRENTVSVRLSRMREKLKNELISGGYSI